MLCKKLHHAAYRCRDARETVDFYTRVLGMRFTHAMGEDHVPSTGQYCPHMHIFFEMEDGSSIAFFEAPTEPGPMRDEIGPQWLQHFAIEVADMDALIQAKADLEAKGVETLGPVGHDGFIQSLYFHDPNGHRLELTARTMADSDLKKFEDEAYAVLDLWQQTHDWSRREEVFGAKSGYVRA